MKAKFLLTAALAVGIISAKAQVVQAINGESKAGWSAAGGTVSIDNKDFKEGTGSLMSVSEGPFRFRNVFKTPIDTGTDGQSGYISFWYYMENLNEVNENRGMLVLSSSGDLEKDCLKFSMKDWSLENGWNYIILNLSDATRRQGDFNGKLNYFVLFQRLQTNPATFKLDNVRFSKNYNDLKLK